MESGAIVDRYLYFLKFFSTWVVLLTVMSKYTADTFNLVFLAIFVIAGAAYISYVYPRYYTYPLGPLQVRVEGAATGIVDYFFHFMLLIYVLETFGDKYSLLSVQTLNSIALLAVYWLLIDYKAVYHVGNDDVKAIFVMFVVTLAVFLTVRRVIIFN